MFVQPSIKCASNMRAVKNPASKSLLRLATALWNKNYRYHKNDKSIFGRPDLTFKKLKIAVFVDAEFLHGKDWKTEKYPFTPDIKWYNTIEKNIKRDADVNNTLVGQGWTVIRFWDQEVKNDLNSCVNIIGKIISSKN